MRPGGAGERAQRVYEGLGLSGLGSAGIRNVYFVDNGFHSRNCAAVRSLILHFGNLFVLGGGGGFLEEIKY